MASLLESRSQIAQELQSNPDLQRKLMASVQAEVGNQSDQAKLAYLESVMNRAAARGMSLDQTISDTGYYPKTTTSKLGRQPSQAEQDFLNPIIQNALGGSNISNFATGNESGSVHSGGAPVTFNPGTGERFVLENPDTKWASGLGYSSTSPSRDWLTGGIGITPGLAGSDTLLNSPEMARIRELQAAMSLSGKQPAAGGGNFGGQLVSAIQAMRSGSGDPFAPGGGLSFGA
jgi:hypothetical protein